jgi:hypothetical protein
MAVKTKRYRKKPVVIEAVQLDGNNAQDVVDWINGNGHQALVIRTSPGTASRLTGEILIHTLEGDHRGDVLDYVIRGVKGEFYPCKPDIFDATYEPDPDA